MWDISTTLYGTTRIRLNVFVYMTDFSRGVMVEGNLLCLSHHPSSTRIKPHHLKPCCIRKFCTNAKTWVAINNLIHSVSHIVYQQIPEHEEIFIMPLTFNRGSFGWSFLVPSPITPSRAQLSAPSPKLSRCALLTSFIGNGILIASKAPVAMIYWRFREAPCSDAMRHQGLPNCTEPSCHLLRITTAFAHERSQQKTGNSCASFVRILR